MERNRTVTFHSIIWKCCFLCFIVVLLVMIAGMKNAVQLNNYISDVVHTTAIPIYADFVIVKKNMFIANPIALFQGSVSTALMNKNIESTIQTIAGVSAVTAQLYITTLQAGCCEKEMRLIAFDPDSDFLLTPFHEIDTLSDSGVFVGSNTGYQIGDIIHVFNVNFTVEEVLSESGMEYDNTIYISFAGAQRIEEAPEANNSLALHGNIADKEQISVLYIKLLTDIEPSEMYDMIKPLSDDIDVYTKPIISNTCCK